MSCRDRVADLVYRYPILDVVARDVRRASELLADCACSGGTIFTCGNGGSYADGQHIVGELLKSFCAPRPLEEKLKSKLARQYGNLGTHLADRLQRGISALALGSQGAFATAFCNDVDPELVFAQELLSLARSGDILICLSTSGGSSNVLCAAITAHAMGIPSVLLSGLHEGPIAQLASCAIHVPETDTYKIQELHLPIYHCLCLSVEDRVFRKQTC